MESGSKVEIHAEVNAYAYAPGMEAGLAIVGMDGNATYHSREEGRIYQAYRARIDYALVTPYILYNGAKLLLRPNDRILLSKSDSVLAVVTIAQLEGITVMSETEPVEKTIEE